MKTCNNIFVYELYHSYEKENGEDEIKGLGIYSTSKLAQEAIERYFILPGFDKYPIDCFHISKYKLDHDSGWKEGFVDTIELENDFKRLTVCFNKWLKIEVNFVEESWEDTNYYNTLCEISPKAYQSKTPQELADYIYLIWQERVLNKPKTIEECLDVAIEVINTLKLRI